MTASGWMLPDTWRDQFPSHWEARPLWSMFTRKKDMGHPDEPMLSVFRDAGVIRKDSRDNLNKTAENRNIYQLVDNGWLVVNRMKAWQGSVGVSPMRGLMSGHYICFSPRHHESSRYLNWLLRSPPYAEAFGLLSRGVRPGQAEIDNEFLYSLPILLPPVDEQRRIADFLDAETGKLGQLVDLRRLQLDLLEERVESRIRLHIGGSPLNDANSPGSLLPLKRVLRKLNRHASPGAGLVTAFRDGQVTARSFRRTEGFTESWTEGALVQGVLRGDVVIHGLDGFAGAIGTSEADGVCSPVYHVCEPAGSGDSAYLGRLLRMLAVDGYLTAYGGSARERAVDFRNWSSFGRLPIPNVSAEEQREIGDMIRAMRPLRVAVERSAALAEERKRSLITAAVTGELDVSSASPRAAGAVVGG